MNKMLVSDFDKTFFMKDDFSKNIEAVNNFVDKGNIFVIATGRHIGSLMRDIDNLNLNYSYLVCNDGGVIFDKDLNVIYQKNIPKNIVEPIATMIEEDKHITKWYIDAGIETNQNKDSIATGIIASITDTDKAKKLLDKITNKFNDIHGYISTEWINITEKTVTKLSAIRVLQEELGIDDSNIFTIGDNVNDISMSIFNSYCMTDSVPELREICQKEYDSVHKLIDYIID